MAEYSRLVYSTDGGRSNRCPTCSRRLDECRCGQPAARPTPARRSAPTVPDDGIVRVHRDRGGRGGKIVTLVTGVPPADAARLVRELRRIAAAGGAMRAAAIEIQGDHREAVVRFLSESGYRVKIAGG
ncbi:MAG: stress response translation initiation inhibitor YciH [Chloroflexi bacterium]|nr:stress response translation initiation inhibitor YciH [Chloroflexota bacterium]